MGSARYTMLGETVDDAAGEAFDKSAKLLGLGYPGGPALAALAQHGRSDAFELPRPLLHKPNLDFSFAGLKTAVAVRVARLPEPLPDGQRADMAASVQAAIVDVLCAKSLRALAATGLKRLVVAGGVGANASLRERLGRECARIGARVHYPELALCTDNGAMIALAAAMRMQHGIGAANADRRLRRAPALGSGAGLKTRASPRYQATVSRFAAGALRLLKVKVSTPFSSLAEDSASSTSAATVKLRA